MSLQAFASDKQAPARESIARAIHDAGETLGVALDQDALRRTVREASAEQDLDDTDTWVAVIADAGSQLGLQFSPIRCSLLDVARMVSPQSAWFSVREENGRPADLVGVFESKNGSVLAADMADGERRWIATKDLAKYLGRNASRPSTWLAVEAAAPVPTPHEDSHEVPWHGAAPLERLKGWLAVERPDLWVMVAFSVAIGILSLVMPVATQALVNTIAFGTLLQPLLVLAVAVLIFLTFAACLRGLRTWVVEIIQRRAFVRVSSDAVYRLVKVRTEAFDSGHGPELVNRFFEVVTVQKAAATLLVDGLEVVMSTLVGLILLGVYHPLLLAFGAVIVAGILIVLFPMGRGAVETAVRESKAKYAMAAWLEEVARFPATFKNASGSAYAVERTNGLVANYLNHRAKHFRILFRQILGSLTLEVIAMTVLLVAGGWLVIEERLTLGQLVAAELIVAVVVGSFAKFGKQLETYYDLLAAVDKLGYLTDLPLEESGSEPLRAAGPAMVQFRNVSFAFGGGDHHGHGHGNGHSVELFHHVDWTIPAGGRVAVYAPGGNGKSTLLDLLYGTRLPSAGVVEIDNQDYRDVRLGDFRSQVAQVRAVEIFHGSIADNLRLGDAKISTAAMRDALDRTGLLEQVLNLPDGLQTELSTNGLPLSRTQAIKLMFARALAQRPRLLIVDEALDIFDDMSICQTLVDTLISKESPWTLVIATRNPNITQLCETVYTIHDGHLELMTGKGSH